MTFVAIIAMTLVPYIVLYSLHHDLPLYHAQELYKVGLNHY